MYQIQIFRYFFVQKARVLQNVLKFTLILTEGQEHVADEDGPRSTTPARFLQWITGQGHVPLLPSEKKDFAVVVKFNHNCEADFGNHSICYPVVSSCAKTIVLPVKHMKSYSQFRMVLLEAFHLGQEFNNV